MNLLNLSAKGGMRQLIWIQFPFKAKEPSLPYNADYPVQVLNWGETTEKEGQASSRGKTWDIIILSLSAFKKVVVCALVLYGGFFLNYSSIFSFKCWINLHAKTMPYRCVVPNCNGNSHHHHHHIVLVARISLTLSCHSSLSFIALGRSSGQHPVSSHSCWMYVRAGRPAFARPCVGIHKSTSLMSSSLLLQQCPACLVRLTWIVFVIGGRWPYSWCLVGCCCQDLFRIARSILV